MMMRVLWNSRFFAVQKYRHKHSAGADADHRRAAVGMGRQAVRLADAVPDHGSLREDQQVLAVPDGLHGGLDRLDICAAPIYRERASHPDEPATPRDSGTAPPWP